MIYVVNQYYLRKMAW